MRDDDGTVRTATVLAQAESVTEELLATLLDQPVKTGSGLGEVRQEMPLQERKVLFGSGELTRVILDELPKKYVLSTSRL